MEAAPVGHMDRVMEGYGKGKALNYSPGRQSRRLALIV